MGFTFLALAGLSACTSKTEDAEQDIRSVPKAETSAKSLPVEKPIDLNHLVEDDYAMSTLEEQYLEIARSNDNNFLETADFESDAGAAFMSQFSQYSAEYEKGKVLEMIRMILYAQSFKKLQTSDQKTRSDIIQNFYNITEYKIAVSKMDSVTSILSKLTNQEYFIQLSPTKRRLTIKSVIYLTKAIILGGDKLSDPNIKRTHDRLLVVRDQIVSGQILIDKYVNKRKFSFGYGKFIKDTKNKGYSVLEVKMDSRLYNPLVLNTLIHECIHAAQFVEGGAKYNMRADREAEAYVDSRIYSLAIEGEQFENAHVKRVIEVYLPQKVSLERDKKNLNGYSNKIKAAKGNEKFSTIMIDARINYMFFYIAESVDSQSIKRSPLKTAMVAAKKYNEGDRVGYEKFLNYTREGWVRGENGLVIIKALNFAHTHWVNFLKKNPNPSLNDINQYFDNNIRLSQGTMVKKHSEEGSEFYRMLILYHCARVFKFAANNEMEEASKIARDDIRPIEYSLGDLEMYNME